MAESIIAVDGIPQSVTLTPNTSAGMTNNNSYIVRIGRLAIFVLDIRKTSGFTRDTSTKLFDTEVHPENFARIETIDTGSVVCMININSTGEVTIYPHSGTATGFVRAIIPFIISE